MIMKYILLLLSLICVKGYSQHYRPFCEDGKQWILLMSTFYGDEYTVVQTLHGDTIIAGIQCLKLTSKEYGYEGAFYEKDGKTYFFYPRATEPTIFYHWTTAINEPFYIYDFVDKRIEYCMYEESTAKWFDGQRVRYIKINRTLEFEEYMANEYDCWEITDENVKTGIWYESVGSIYGPAKPHEYHFLKRYWDGYPRLLICSLGDEVLYMDPKYEQVQGVSYLLESSCRFPSVDLTGRKINEPFVRHGIYIKDGKKVLR